MPFAEAQDYFQIDNAASAIEIMVAKPDEVDSYIGPLNVAARGHLQFVTWKTTNQTFFNALQVESNVMFLILTLIILVAALNIVSGLIMLVKDKGHDIAILRTMGATSGAVLRIFFMTGAAIGTLGTLAGVGLGVVICQNIEEIRQFLSALTQRELFSPELYYLSRLPADMDLHQTVAIALMSLGLSFLATLYPSWRAARLDPVEALRYE
jgi:lipoprotein-releasing system permease protein